MLQTEDRTECVVCTLTHFHMPSDEISLTLRENVAAEGSLNYH